MKLVGFRKEYDKRLWEKSRQHRYETIQLSSKKDQTAILDYLNKAELVFTKTLSIYDGNIFIGPYVIHSDGEWVWPKYLGYFVEKEKVLDEEFYQYLLSKQYCMTELPLKRKREIISFLEKTFLEK
jgi:hypothetical protein